MMHFMSKMGVKNTQSSICTRKNNSKNIVLEQNQKPKNENEKERRKNWHITQEQYLSLHNEFRNLIDICVWVKKTHTEDILTIAWTQNINNNWERQFTQTSKHADNIVSAFCLNKLRGVERGIVLGEKAWGATVQGATVQGAIILRGNWPRGELSGWGINQGGIVQGAIDLGGNCPGGNWPDTVLNNAKVSHTNVRIPNSCTQHSQGDLKNPQLWQQLRNTLLTKSLITVSRFILYCIKLLLKTSQITSQTITMETRVARSQP